MLFRVKKIAVPIYYGHLQVIITDSFKEASDKLGIDHGDIDPESVGAFVTVKENGRGLELFTIMIKEDVGAGLLSHEVVHLVNAIFQRRGIKPDTINDEPQAYLTGWITEQIYKTIWTAQKK